MEIDEFLKELAKNHPESDLNKNKIINWLTGSSSKYLDARLNAAADILLYEIKNFNLSKLTAKAEGIPKGKSVEPAGVNRNILGNRSAEDAFDELAKADIEKANLYSELSRITFYRPAWDVLLDIKALNNYWIISRINDFIFENYADRSSDFWSEVKSFEVIFTSTDAKIRNLLHICASGIEIKDKSFFRKNKISSIFSNKKCSRGDTAHAVIEFTAEYHEYSSLISIALLRFPLDCDWNDLGVADHKKLKSIPLVEYHGGEGVFKTISLDLYTEMVGNILRYYSANTESIIWCILAKYYQWEWMRIPNDEIYNSNIQESRIAFLQVISDAIQMHRNLYLGKSPVGFQELSVIVSPLLIPLACDGLDDYPGWFNKVDKSLVFVFGIDGIFDGLNYADFWSSESHDERFNVAKYIIRIMQNNDEYLLSEAIFSIWLLREIKIIEQYGQSYLYRGIKWYLQNFSNLSSEFSKLLSSISSRYEGTGLGRLVAKKIDQKELNLEEPLTVAAKNACKKVFGNELWMRMRPHWNKYFEMVMANHLQLDIIPRDDYGSQCVLIAKQFEMAMREKIASIVETESKLIDSVYYEIQQIKGRPYNLKKLEYGQALEILKKCSRNPNRFPNTIKVFGRYFNFQNSSRAIEFLFSVSKLRNHGAHNVANRQAYQDLYDKCFNPKAIRELLFFLNE